MEQYQCTLRGFIMGASVWVFIVLVFQCGSLCGCFSVGLQCGSSVWGPWGCVSELLSTKQPLIVKVVAIMLFFIIGYYYIYSLFFLHSITIQGNVQFIRNCRFLKIYPINLYKKIQSKPWQKNAKFCMWISDIKKCLSNKMFITK